MSFQKSITRPAASFKKQLEHPAELVGSLLDEAQPEMQYTVRGADVRDFIFNRNAKFLTGIIVKSTEAMDDDPAFQGVAIIANYPGIIQSALERLRGRIPQAVSHMNILD